MSCLRWRRNTASSSKWFYAILISMLLANFSAEPVLAGTPGFANGHGVVVLLTEDRGDPSTKRSTAVTRGLRGDRDRTDGSGIPGDR